MTVEIFNVRRAGSIGGSAMQRALLGAAIALILVLVTALVGPLFVDWGRYRPTFETEISRLTRLDVRIGGPIDVRLLPTPTLILREIALGRADESARIRAEALRIELALGALMRGQFLASEVALDAPEISIRLGGSEQPPSYPSPQAREGGQGVFAFDAEAVSIAHLAIDNGRVVLAGGSGRSFLLDRLGFSGDARSLLGPVKGEGTVAVDGDVYLFRLAADRPTADGAIKVRLLVDSVDHARVGDLDSSIWIERGIPHFAGALQWSHAAGRSTQSFSEPWRVSAKIHGNWLAATLEGIALQYGSEDRAVQLHGHANLTFRAQPELDATLAATRIDLDRMLDLPATVRRQPLVAMHTMADNFGLAVLPSIRMTLGLSAEAVTLGEAPVQYVSASLRGEGSAWDLDSLELRAPGGTQLKLRGHLDLAARNASFAGRGAVETRDSHALVWWLTAGRQGDAFAGPFRAEGDLRLSREGFAFDRFKATLDRDTLEGNFAYLGPTADHSGRISAILSASEIDLNRAYTLIQHLSGDTALGLPHEGLLSLNVGRARIAGIEAKSADMRLQFDEQSLAVERLAIDDFGGARIAAAGAIDLRTLAPRGAITLDLDVRAPDGVAALVETFNAPAAAALRRTPSRLLPARLRGSLANDAQAASDAGIPAGLSFKIGGNADVFAFDLQGVAEAPGSGSLFAALGQPASGNVVVAGHIETGDGRTLVEAVGLDRLVSVDERVGRLDFKASGRLGDGMTVAAQAIAGGLSVSLSGSLQAAQSQTPTASLVIAIGQANVRVPTGTVPTNLTARLNFADGAIALDQITGKVAASDVGGRLIIGLSPTMTLDGDIKLGGVDVPAAIAAAVGMPAQRTIDGVPWPVDPFVDGVLGQVRGRIAIASARATLAAHLVAENLQGVLNFAPSEIAWDAFGADLAGGQVSGRLAFERDGNELRVRSRVKLTKADMTALFSANSQPVTGRLNLDAEVEGRGRSPAALIGSLQGKGFFSIEGGRFARLDPSAFDAVIRSVDQGLPIEVTQIRQRLEAALAGGTLSAEGNGAITVAAGKASLTALMLRAQGADLTVSARYDLVNQAVDAKLTLVGAAGIGNADVRRPEIAVSLQGPIDSPRRTLDVAALVDWLSTRAIVENAKRLAAISAPLAAHPAESTSPPAAQPAVPANSADAPVAPANESKAAAPAVPNLAKPESAAGRVAGVEAPGNAPSAVRPAGGDAFSATQPAPATPPSPAARDTAAIGLPGGTNLSRAEPPADPAVAELDRVISANPNDVAAIDRRGRLLAFHGRYSSAIKDFDNVIRLRPDAEAFNNRCWVRAIIGDLQSALNDCNAALQLHPSYADAFDSRAMVNLKSGQPGKAVADYDAALRIDPNRANSLFGRGLAKIKIDNVAGGNLDLAKAKSIQANIAEEFASYGIR
jgi:tetratricopeptide (TPR) repeat protein